MDIKIKRTNQYTQKIMMKSNYNTVQNKWRKNYAKWFTKLNKKDIS